MTKNQKIRFLAFIQHCMENNSAVNLRDLLENITTTNMLKSVNFKTRLLEDESDLKDHEKWNKEKDRVVYDHYDSKLGHCISIDIGPLYGKVPPRTMEEVATLKISPNFTIKNLEGTTTSLFLFVWQPS